MLYTPRRSKDRQRSSSGDRLALVGFIVGLVLLHWLPVLRYVQLGLAASSQVVLVSKGFQQGGLEGRCRSGYSLCFAATTPGPVWSSINYLSLSNGHRSKQDKG